MTDIKLATKLAYRNRAAAEKAEHCGCYFCLRVFPSKTIDEWADGGETALCPNCRIDSVVPDAPNAEWLVEAHEYWFCRETKE